MRSRTQNFGRRAAAAAAAGSALAALLAVASRAVADDHFTVCSITINSDDEIKAFKKHLPGSAFEFVELTDFARTPSGDVENGWFSKACESGVQCDLLVLSGHFGNTYAGSFGTTFQGESGLKLSLDELEQRSCDKSCPGILASPLEVFLFGCKTLAASLDDQPLPREDLATLAAAGVPPAAAERMVEEERNRGADTSNRQRMRFVFAGVPHLYGFSLVAPTGERAGPLLNNYFRAIGDYAAHLRQLSPLSNRQRGVSENVALAQTIQPSSFAQCDGLDPREPEYKRDARVCFLKNDRSSVVARLEHIEKLLDEPGFLAYLPAIAGFFREHRPESFGAAEQDSLQRLRKHDRAGQTLGRVIDEVKTPILRLDAVRVAHAVGWISDQRALQVHREIILQVLRPPVYGEGRDIACSFDPEIVKRIDLRAEDLRPEVYADEFGIQALGCLKPADERIHLGLSRSLFDSRDWIARLAAIALKEIKPARVDVQIALAQQLDRPESSGRRQWAGQALRELHPSDPRVLEAIRKTDPSFQIDPP